MSIIINQANKHSVGGSAKIAHACPKCKIPMNYRVHRGKFVKLIFPWLPINRYICHRCLHKYYVFKK